MDKIRGKITIGQDQRVVVDGYYYYIDHRHYISSGKHLLLASTEQVVVFVEIDPAQAAVATGRKDKHGTEIYGSKGIFQGGDRLSIITKSDCELGIWDVCWANWSYGWRFRTGPTSFPLEHWPLAELEILKEKD